MDTQTKPIPTTAEAESGQRLGGTHFGLRSNCDSAEATNRIEPVLLTESTVHAVGVPAQVLSTVVYSAKSSSISLRQYQTIDELLLKIAPDSTGCLFVSFTDDLPGNAMLMSQLATKVPLLPVVGCLNEQSVTAAIDLMHRGAFTVVTLPADTETLGTTINAAIERSRSLQSDQYSGQAAVLKMDRATKKEIEVLELILQGYKNKEIGVELGITVRAVEDRRFRLMKKVGVDSVAELVALAMSARFHRLMYPDGIRGYR